MQNLIVREARLEDLPGLTEIYNHYVIHTHVTFDLEPVTPQQRMPWFEDHTNGGRYRTFVAYDPEKGVLGYACTGRFRPKAAYGTTVEASVYCRPDVTSKGLGRTLYTRLFDALANEDIQRIVAGIALPNAASLALHERFGFKPIGVFTQVGRKFDKYWDVLWLERPLKLAVLEDRAGS